MTVATDSKVNWRTFGICIIISLGQFVAAYQSVIIGTTLGKPDFMQTVSLWGKDNKPIGNNASLEGAIVGTCQAGAIFGCIFGAFIMDRWGRKAGFFVGCIITLLGLAGLTGAVNMPMFLAFRFIVGFGTWMHAVVSATYCSELAPPQFRGFFAGLNGIMIGGGVAIASYIGMGFYFSGNPAAQWRAPMGIPMIIPIIMLCCWTITPESPRFLLLKGRADEAWVVLSHIYRIDGDEDESNARAEFFQMKEQAHHDRSLDASWAGLFNSKANLKRLYIGCVFTFLAQSTGVLVINNYGTTFYQAMGYGPADRQLLQGNRDIIALIGNVVGSMVVDRVGRRAITMFGFIGCAACLAVETAMVALYAGTNNTAGQKTGVAFIYIFLGFYSGGIDVGIYVLLGEIFPNHTRVKGIGLSLAVLNIASTIYLTTTSIAFAALGYKFFLIFLSISVFAVVWIFFFVPETKNLPLEEVAALFGDDENVMVYLRTTKDGGEIPVAVDHSKTDISTTHVEKAA
ncbi:general substrate transporter [Xylariales sp. AK1849]|nr:general substrate transporter [Xylariales sp. AK1849]